MKLLETKSKFKVLTKNESKKIVGGNRIMCFSTASMVDLIESENNLKNKMYGATNF